MTIFSLSVNSCHTVGSSTGLRSTRRSRYYHVRSLGVSHVMKLTRSTKLEVDEDSADRSQNQRCSLRIPFLLEVIEVECRLSHV